MRAFASKHRLVISSAFLVVFAAYMVLSVVTPRVATPIGIGLVGLVLAFSVLVHMPTDPPKGRDGADV